jgi:cytoskeletal protein CcmA (bactofilin family)/uncharacterized Tic20 family protein
MRLTWHRDGPLVLLALLGALVLGPAAAIPAHAFETRGGDLVTVPAGTTLNDDLVAMAQAINIAGDVTGDVFALGSTITVTGTIGGDLIAAGQQITVDGVVQGDIRAAGQQVTINGRVDGSVTTAGQQIVVGRQGAVGGSLLVGAQDVNLVGTVGRSVLTGAGALQLGGSVGGNVNAHVERLNVDPNARVGGKLLYSSPDQVVVPAGVATGGVEYQAPDRAERQRDERRDNLFGSLSVIFNVIWLVGSVIAGVLLVHFLPAFASSTAEQVRHHPLSSFGIGVVAMFIVPVVALIVAVTLIGLPLSFLAVLGYLLAIYVGQLLLGLAVGAVLVELVRRRGTVPHVGPEWLVVLGLVVVYVVTHLPWIGGLATFIAICLGLGAVLRQLGENWQARRAAAAPPAY